MAVHHYDLSNQVVEIYRLLTIVEANKIWFDINNIKKPGNQDFYLRLNRIQHRVQKPEISRLVLSLAAASRSTIDQVELETDRRIARTESALAAGTMYLPRYGEEIDKQRWAAEDERHEKDKAVKQALLALKQRKVGSLGGHLQRGKDEKPLHFHFACSKVLHADSVTMAFAQRAGSEAGLIHLAGRYQGEEWLATLDLKEFALAAFDVVHITDTDDRSWYDR